MTNQKDARISSPDILPHDVHDILASDPFLATLNINAVAPIIGGVAHRVYRIESGKDAYYLKIRGDHFVAIPTISCNPNDITHEYRALSSFTGAAPDHFPKVLSFNKDHHYLVLSDVIQDGSKLEQMLLGGKPPKGLFRLYGRTLATIQRKTAHITEPIRPEGDEAYYRTVLGHRFGYRNHPVLNDAVDNLSRLPNRQLIMGDPAPKNMGIRQKGHLLTFFDLETAHQGNPEFDFVYGLAHTMLHTIPNIEPMRQAVRDFLSGYGKVPYDLKLIYRLTLGIVLYRLHSVIPYPIALSSEEKTIMETHTERELFKITGKESWSDIITRLTSI
ncbi:MAG: aminoglycoside phosphotransferase family protein [Patescibacteria group bacterium]